MRKTVALALVMSAVGVAAWIEPAIAQTAEEIAQPLVQKTDEIIALGMTWAQRIAVVAGIGFLLAAMFGRIAWSWGLGICGGAVGLFLLEPIIQWAAS